MAFVDFTWLSMVHALCWKWFIQPLTMLSRNLVRWIFRAINGYTSALAMMVLPKAQAINYTWMAKNCQQSLTRISYTRTYFLLIVVYNRGYNSEHGREAKAWQAEKFTQ